MSISLIDIEELMPETIIYNDYFGEEEIRKTNRMFSGTDQRRHVGRDELASDYLSTAAMRLIERLGLNANNDIDMIVTNVSIPDEPFTGCGAVINKKIGGKAKWIFDIHNTGCISFLYLTDLVHTYMKAKDVRHAIICVAQTAGGRIFGQVDTRQMAQAAIPGDGFAVAYLTNNSERPFLTFEFENYPEFSEDMVSSCKGRHWWESRESSGSIDFNENKSAMIIGRGNKTVPRMIKKVCDNIDILHTQIDYLITNQPNANFLRNWREAISLPPERQLHTFPQYANLFGAAIPVNLATYIKNKTIKPGDLICMAGFSHACDYSASALIRWT
ncbi:MAG: 3-oxoacyl-[acyl-carrier-protein] synthase III C-terminal domain-containing protein [Bacteriovorax sp.]|jgi:3-oxoacyl-[acyl-carrier-protein] synthase-3